MIECPKILAVAAVSLVAGVAGFGQRSEAARYLKPALDSIQAERLTEHVRILASDKFEGRGPATRGETLTVDYLIDQFRIAGLKPGNPNGTFIQNVPLVGYQTFPTLSVSAAGRQLSLKFIDEFVHDFPVLRPSARATDLPVVFAGYGIVAPEYGWDDYKGVDVSGKLVVLLSGEPERVDKRDPKKLDPEFFRGETRTYYATRESKFDIASRKGAAGILVIYDPEKANTYSLFQTFAKMEGFAIRPKTANQRTLISGLVTLAAASRFLSASGNDLKALEAAAKMPGFAAKDVNARAEISVKSRLRYVTSRNVIARVEGSDPDLKDEYLIYSAHWDHLGRDRTLKGDQIYNGAMDNAIGTAQLLEIAKGFAKVKPKRSILFIAVTAEEKGYLGSRYYVQNPLYPISKTIANINLDGGNAWGVTSDIFTANYGLSTLDETLEAAANSQGREFVRESLGDGGLYFGSDQVEFAKAGIPAIFPFSGFSYVGKAKDFGDKKWESYSDNDYHKVSDELKSDWDLSGAAEDAKWLLIAGYNLGDSSQRPEWKAGVEFRRRSTSSSKAH
jgi:Zn-dependent M28 family amino/carboxypeptidase